MALIFERNGKWAINYLDELGQRAQRELDANQSIVDAKRIAVALEFMAAARRRHSAESASNGGA